MPRKYRNQPVEVDGIQFASKREARHYAELRLLERAGEIQDLEVHPAIGLTVAGVRICRIVPDFRFIETRSGALRYQDTKGVVTRDWKLKAKLFQAIHGTEIEIIK